jgi:membrane-bound lytic murein transglycosylase D
LLPLSCASTADQPKAASTAAVDYRAWEEATRARADEAMAEAQRLLGEGDTAAAIDMADEALCEVFAVPLGYPIRDAYLDYLADLIDEATDIEASLQQFEEEQVVTEELAVLPPVDTLDVAAEVEEALEDGGIPESDFPLLLNPPVEGFLFAMTSQGEFHRRIALGLERSGPYLPMIRARFAAAGLPVDLSYLPLIESAFSLTAYSRARAHGMWQFISSTARHYGLEVGTMVDERRDPVLSTDAAIAYLKDLHGEFNDWYLALAAYNSGAGNVRRAIRRSGSEDFWTLRSHLPRETRDYVPAFIASVIVAKRPAAFGFSPPDERPWEYDSLEVPDALDLQFLASGSGIPLEELRALNPAIRRDLTPARVTTSLRLPAGTRDSAAAVLERSPRSEWAPRTIHVVRSGDSLHAIARRYGSSVEEIRQANGLRGSLIHPGQELTVPRFGSQVAATDARDYAVKGDGTYVVRRGDTLWDIARGLGLSVDSLRTANGLSANPVIRPGQSLRLPGRGGSPPAAAGAARVTARSDRETAPDAASYVVRGGDTLSGIASLHRTSVAALKELNGLTSSRIRPGDVLLIPGRSKVSGDTRTAVGELTYRVRKGDTLYAIARRHGVSVADLTKANGLNGTRIRPGDLLRIPRAQASG